VLTELAGQGLRVDVAEVGTEGIGQLLRRGLGEARRVGAAELGERVAALARGAELGDVALPMPAMKSRSGASAGPTPASVAAATQRPPSSAAQARACGPPPEVP
jgi:hypothetical protein